MTRDKLEACTRKTFADLVRKQGIPGWHSMKKGELLEALLRSAKSRAKRNAAVKRTAGTVPEKRVNGKTAPRVAGHAEAGDRLSAVPRDSHWLHLSWRVSLETLHRAEAALGTEWHLARPVLRLFDVTSEDTTGATNARIADVEVDGAVESWYLRVENPQRAYKLHLGYLAPSGKFFSLARTATVRMPEAGAESALRPRAGRPGDTKGAATNGHTTSLLQSKPNGSRPHEVSQLTRQQLAYLAAAKSQRHLAPVEDAVPDKDFSLRLEAELVVFGATHPGAELTVMGNRIRVSPDGTFDFRLSLPNGRQVIPAVAVTPNGAEERTVVLAIERNTRELEPRVFDEIPQ